MLKFPALNELKKPLNWMLMRQEEFSVINPNATRWYKSVRLDNFLWDIIVDDRSVNNTL